MNKKKIIELIDTCAKALFYCGVIIVFSDSNMPIFLKIPILIGVCWLFIKNTFIDSGEISR